MSVGRRPVLVHGIRTQIVFDAENVLTRMMTSPSCPPRLSFLDSHISGYDFLFQVDAALARMVNKIHGTNFTAQIFKSMHAARPAEELTTYMHTSDTINSTKILLTPVNECCVARYYAKDYELIEKLAATSCRGEDHERQGTS